MSAVDVGEKNESFGHKYGHLNGECQNRDCGLVEPGPTFDIFIIENVFL